MVGVDVIEIEGFGGSWEVEDLRWVVVMVVFVLMLVGR